VKELWVNQLRLRLMRKGSNPLSSAAATENYENLILSLTRATSGLLHHNRCKTGRERDRGRERKEIERGEKHRVAYVWWSIRDGQTLWGSIHTFWWWFYLEPTLTCVTSSVPVSLLHSSSSLTQSVSAIFTAKQEERNKKKHSYDKYKINLPEKQSCQMTCFRRIIVC